MPRRVILLIESSRAYGRGCLLGIAAWLRAHRNWETLHLERGLDAAIPTMLKRFDAHGIIARIENRRVAKAIERFALPTVDLRGAFKPRNGAMLDTDPAACADLAAEHFHQRGFRQLAYCGYAGVNFSDQRCSAFLAACNARQLDVAVFPQTRTRTTADDTLRQEALGELSEQAIARWLDDLPKPLGVLACNDVRGRQVLGACAKASYHVPDQVAVLGIDNDEVICDLSNPPLSSIEPDTHRLGHEGAAILDRMMRGRKAPRRTRLIRPRGVVVRRSTYAVAVDDPQIAAALRFIRDRAADGIDVSDVIKQLNISRATLERRMTQQLGRTPKEEIDRVRIERLQLLLQETSYPLSQLARMTGYRSTAHLATAFKRCTGLTPGQYRADREHLAP